MKERGEAISSDLFLARLDRSSVRVIIWKITILDVVVLIWRLCSPVMTCPVI